MTGPDAAGHGDGVTAPFPGPWRTICNASRLIHVETDEGNPIGTGVPICSIPAKFKANAELLASAPSLAADNARLRAERDAAVELLTRATAALETPGDLDSDEIGHVVEDCGVWLADFESRARAALAQEGGR